MLSPHPGTATTEAAGDIQHSPKQAQMWGTQPTHGEEEEGRAEARTEEEEEEKSSCHPRAAATQPAPCSGGGLGMRSPRQLTEAGSCQGPCMAQAGTHSFTVHRRSCLAAHRGRQTGRQTDRHPLMGTSTHPQECPSIHPPPTPHPPAFPSICPLALLSNHPSAHPPAQRVVHPYAHLLSHPAECLSSCPPTWNIQPAIHQSVPASMVGHPSVHLPAHLSTHPSAHRNIYLSVHPSIYSFIHPPTHRGISVYLSTHPPT